MENPFLSGPTQLSKLWRILRSQLTSNLTDLEQLQLVVKFWSHTPISSPFLNWDNPSIWPTPWELIQENNFDVSSIALGMEYTLLLSEDQRWAPDRLILNLSCTQDQSQQQLTLNVDNLYVLNYEYNKIVPIDTASKQLVIQQSYLYNNKMHKFKV